MTTVEWLNRANGLRAELKETEEIYRNAMERACGTTAVPNLARASGVQNNTEYKFAAVAEFGERLREKISELYGVLNEITDLIDRVSESRLRTLLKARYISGKSWEETAEILEMSTFWVRTRVHSQALSEIEILRTQGRKKQ